jgi:hypothetical protein
MKNPDSLLEMSWQLFLNNRKLSGASEALKAEIKLAFYLGMGSILNGLKVLEDAGNKEFSADVIQIWREEFEEFLKATARNADRN